MPIIHLRFYEELNDHLAREQRRQTFEWKCTKGATARAVVEALGVPTAEIDLILINGESASFECKLRDGDRVSVYPKFKSFDVSTVQRLHRPPLA